MSEENKFLSVKDLVVEYTSEGSVIHAVNGVSLSLEKGSVLGLVGETGAGKTTIAKSILRVLPDISARVVGGEILLNGEDLLKKPEKEMEKVRGEKISMIFQDPMTALNPTHTVGSQVSEAIIAHNDISKAEAEKRAIDMLEMVGIKSDRYKDYPFQLSGGMKQRIVIAMALACDPELLLADEPTTALDVTIQAQVLDMVRNLRNELGTSMILITHDLGVIGEMCDNVDVIYAGEIIESGTKWDIFDRPAHPYTVGLFNALPDISKKTHRLHPIAGLPPDPSNLPAGCNFSPRCPYATEECKKNSPPMVEITEGHFCKCTHRDQISREG